MTKNTDTEAEDPTSKPAVTTLPNGVREWRVDGELHREDGPAVEYPEGGDEWWSL